MKPSGHTGVDNGATIPQQQQHHPQQEELMASAHALARPPTPGKQPQTAQLTIFYASMVNVYDEAQAIMLLAGKGSTWSSNYTNIPVDSCGPAPGHPVPTAPSPVSEGVRVEREEARSRRWCSSRARRQRQRHLTGVEEIIGEELEGLTEYEKKALKAELKGNIEKGSIEKGVTIAKKQAATV